MSNGPSDDHEAEHSGSALLKNLAATAFLGLFSWHLLTLHNIEKPAVKNASEERWAERRRRGIAGKGGDDLSHTKGGKMVLESPKRNRARNGHNGKPSKK
jgi:hypothetical protein